MGAIGARLMAESFNNILTQTHLPPAVCHAPPLPHSWLFE